MAVKMYRSLTFVLLSVTCLESAVGEDIFDLLKYQNNLRNTQDLQLVLETNLNADDIRIFESGLKNEDIYLNISQLITKYGYNVEEHDVKTADGYILKLIRIPSNGPVVFLMHGLLLSADDWVTAGPQSGIAYLLANEGYDVWMGNARGNKHSRRHQVLSPSTPAFWDFSFDEIGRIDVPTMIDYVLRGTDQTQLAYIGHSQGTTAFLVMCSELVEYNKKISVMIALTAPTAIANLKSPFILFIKYIVVHYPDKISSLLKEIGLYEFLPSNKLTDALRGIICGKKKVGQIICNNIIFLIMGFDPGQLNITSLPVTHAHAPAGASTKQIEHYAQGVLSGKFQRFDYGRSQNLKLYGSIQPPDYKLERISAPMSLFYSDNDWLVSVEDVKILGKQLRNVFEYYRVPLPTFNHLDYLYAKDLKELLFFKIFYLLKKYYV